MNEPSLKKSSFWLIILLMLRGLKQFNLPEIEEKVLDFWRENNIFSKTLSQSKGKREFIFYEGPPTANGRPGTHHILARAFKDIILRFKTMQGYYAPRRAGWDTQGLPVEIEVEKELGIKNKQDIEKFGIAEFNKKAKESVWKYKDEWEKLTERIGFWLDFENAYITYENDYLEKLWGVFKKIDERGLLNKFYKVVPWCPRCQTSLSSHELGQPGAYKKVKDPSVYIKFQIPSSKSQVNEYLLIWTTTPWTLPANLAIAVNPELTYTKYEINGEYIWAVNAPPFSSDTKIEVIEKLSGKKMIGLKYESLYENNGPHEVVKADFVSAEDGTGLIHIASFGEDDLNLMRNKMSDFPVTIDDQGIMKNGLPGAGKYIKEADKDILEDLQKRNLLFYQTTIEHDYPFCWRCSRALIYFPRFSWFIEMSKLRSDLLKANEKINWIPHHLQSGRFGEWLQGVKDWAISRERYWGTPLPIWECEKCDEKLVIGSRDELKEHGGEAPADLHRPYIDEVKLICPKCNGSMTRVKEVADVWFDSGGMPFASGEYPNRYPADYICEAIDQTRGWFYTLLAIGVLLNEDTPYKNVISLGHLLDKHGQKMSKSKNNIVDPWEMIDKYGVDVIRWYFYTVNPPAEPKKFDEAELSKAFRRFISLLYNSYVFFETYSKNEPQVPSASWRTNFQLSNILDKWIFSRLNETILEVEENLNKYEIGYAAKILELFVSDLSHWYIRRSRKRAEALPILQNVLLEISKLIAPFVPFFADALYKSLSGGVSVHLEEWPRVDPTSLKLRGASKKLIEDMSDVRTLASLALAKRAEAGIKIRQPLRKLKIKNEKLKNNEELLHILADEINVKEIIFDSKINDEIELDINITEELKNEGAVRELARAIQGLRRDAEYSPQNKIILHADLPKKLQSVLESNKGFRKDINAEEIIFERTEKVEHFIEVDLDGSKIWLGIRK